MKKTYKILVSLLIMFLLIGAIFFFSEQSGSDSHSLSYSVARRVANVWAKTFWTDSQKYSVDLLASMLDGPVRKLAHIFIYTLLGFGACLSAHILKDGKLRFIHIFLCILIVFAVAGCDEINQYYSGGRGACFSDVLIDTFGGSLGIYLIYFIKDFVGHIMSAVKREKDLKNGPEA